MPPIANNHIVGIWDSNSTLLSSAIVTPSSELSGSFRYTNISPIVLDAETTYVIGAENDAGDLFCRSTEYSSQPEINYSAEREYAAKITDRVACFVLKINGCPIGR